MDANSLDPNIVAVFFLYGLAFFSMGLAVWLESGRASQLRLARAMGPLAAFAILHSLHEWLEMFQRLGVLVPGAPAVGQTLAADAVRVSLLALSFVMLIVFGVRLLHSSGKGRGNERSFVLLSLGLLTTIWLVSVIATQQVYDLCLADCIVSIDVLTRYILGIPASILAAWAMILERRAFRERGLVSFGRDLQIAAVALFVYGVFGQSFPPESVLFPANVVNSALFMDLFGFPVQLFRALAAAVVAIFIVRALRAFELEHQQNLAAAREERLRAQQAALETEERTRRETERLNRQLRLAVQDLTLLFELSRSLATTLDQDELMQKALHKILEGIPRIQAGMILCRDQIGEPARVAVSAGCDSVAGASLPVLSCEGIRRVGERVLESGQPVLQAQDETTLLAHSVSAEPVLSPDLFDAEVKGQVLGVPLVAQGRLCGALVLGVGRGELPLTNRDLSLVSTVASQLSIAMENAMLYEEVQEREALRGELYGRIVSAQERERQRIARELHDGTGQVLTGLGLGLMAAAENVTAHPDQASQQLIELKNLNAQALQELRDLIRDLRPSILDDLGLVPAVQAQVKEFEARTGVGAAFMADGPRQRLPSEIETVIFRIAQESLTNVAKHAEAQHVLVRLIFSEESVQLIVTDDGRGFDPDEALGADGRERRAWGLLGIQERITLVGGGFEIASRPGQGTTVRVWAPLDEVSNEASDEASSEGVSDG